MVDSNYITDLAEATTLRYGGFIRGLEGLYAQATDGTHPLMVKNAMRGDSTYAVGVTGLATSFLENELARIDQATHSLADEAIAASGVVSSEQQREQLSVYLNEHVQAVGAALTDQVNRDVRALAGQINRLALQADILRQQNGWTYVGALIRVREQSKNAMKFSFVDRAGRRWDSGRYVQTLVREHYLNVYNETLMYALAWAGRNTARVLYPDAAHAGNGAVFKFVDDGRQDGVPLYADIKAKFFHPNSTALVGP